MSSVIQLLVIYKNIKITNDCVAYQKRIKVGNSNEIYVIYTFNKNLTEDKNFLSSLDNLADYYLPAKTGWLLLCSENNKTQVINYLNERIFNGDDFKCIKVQQKVKNELSEIIINDLRAIFSDEVIGKIGFDIYYVQSNKLEEEFSMETEIDIKGIIQRTWDEGDTRRRLLLHASILQTQGNQPNHALTLQTRLGLSQESFELLLEQLSNQGIVEPNYSGLLRTDNKAAKYINELVDSTYHPSQSVKYFYPLDEKKIQSVTGYNLIEIAYDNRTTKKFTQIVQGIFGLYFSNASQKLLSPEGDIFDLNYKDQWYAILLVRAKKSIIRVNEVATSLLYTQSKQKQTQGNKFIVDIVCGPSFEREAIKQATNAGVYLLDVYSLLSLSKFLSERTNEELEQVQANFPKFFTKGGGFISVSQGIATMISLFSAKS